MKKIAILVFAVMVCVPHLPAYAVADGTTPSPVSDRAASSLATYDGRTIDLRAGWGGAHACYVDDTATTCFDTEQEMDAFVAAPEPSAASALKGSARLTNCSSNLWLYDGISYGGSVLGIGVRFTVLNLSNYGFDNMTTSYKVGACSSNMWNGASGSGSVYPGNTSAGAQSPNMVTGWNNTISSVYVA
jgi:hypothetical protein